MKFIRDLMSRKPKDPSDEGASFNNEIAPFEDVIGYGDDRTATPKSEIAAPPAIDLPREAKLEVRGAGRQTSASLEESNEILQKLTSRLKDEPTGGANIWDIEDENDTVEPAVAVPPTPATAPRRRRNATRVLGFDASQTDVVTMFDEAPKAAPAERTKFPVGWMLVADGEGRGECFTLEAGMSQIGRGEDQAIQLDFGDNSISRTNHAAVVYDTETHTFSLGHGGKKNIVRLNGKPVISNETLSAGDKIKIGETTLHFVPLCSEEFNWAEEDDTGENDNVAIA